MENASVITRKIKEYALSMGFDACGICRAEPVDTQQQKSLDEWLEKGYQADMDYLSRNTDIRKNPALIMEEAKSIICLALNYYPSIKRPASAPRFAYYSYGKDYHDVLKNKLRELSAYIKENFPHVSTREFVDTAPLLERYWAAKAGIGFIGKNTLLILPRKGSYFFLGEIVLDIDLDYDKPLDISCGKCTRCLQACPTQAIIENGLIDSQKCISYQTIEKRGEMDGHILPKLKNNIYGCDICQQVCPFNRFAQPTQVEEFIPSAEFLSLDYEQLQNLSVEEYRRIFKGSAVKRAKYEGLMRNINSIDPGQI